MFSPFLVDMIEALPEKGKSHTNLFLPYSLIFPKNLEFANKFKLAKLFAEKRTFWSFGIFKKIDVFEFWRVLRGFLNFGRNRI